MKTHIIQTQSIWHSFMEIYTFGNSLMGTIFAYEICLVRNWSIFGDLHSIHFNKRHYTRMRFKNSEICEAEIKTEIVEY